MSESANLECIPWKGGIPPFLQRLGGGWQVVNEHHPDKDFRLTGFSQALDFAKGIGDQQGGSTTIRAFAWPGGECAG